ncbi:MAG: hypothetical protein R3E01_01080 [Pirellulaceae bacterium]
MPARLAVPRPEGPTQPLPAAKPPVTRLPTVLRAPRATQVCYGPVPGLYSHVVVRPSFDHRSVAGAIFEYDEVACGCPPPARRALRRCNVAALRLGTAVEL